jgi:predicted RNA binding protein YcfA (HicA-like mRNA interferase family)
MPRKIRQLKADLRKAGAVQVAQEGSHTKWKHPQVPGILIELAGSDGDDAKHYQERDLRDALHHIHEAIRGTDA